MLSFLLAAMIIVMITPIIPKINPASNQTTTVPTLGELLLPRLGCSDILKLLSTLLAVFSVFFIKCSAVCASDFD